MRKSLTLAEVLVAILFLVVVLSGLLMLFVNCMLLNEANRNLTVAVSHAHYIMEEIRGEDFSLVETKINNGDWDLDAAELSVAPYHLTALDNETIDTGVEATGNLLEVETRVDWQDRRQRARTISLKTYLTDYQ